MKPLLRSGQGRDDSAMDSQAAHLLIVAGLGILVALLIAVRAA